MDALLEVNDLTIQFRTPEGVITAVEGVGFRVRKGELLCVVGESGCGKSVTALSILRLLADNALYVSGDIQFEGQNLLELSEKEMREIRGSDISMIFQEPMTSLNPVHTIGKQISEAYLLHIEKDKKKAWDKSIEMLKMVGVPDAERVAKSFPHQLSGGMRQRVMIATAMICQPKLLIADEPTTALDVTIQAQILDILSDLQEKNDLAIMFITHDLAIVAKIADYIIVMYAGKIVEEGTPEAIFFEPMHPYTEGLLKCIPRVDQKVDELFVIAGNVPNPSTYASGCRFHDRCPYATELCEKEMPALELRDGRKYACHFTPADRKIRGGAHVD
ncbi:MAG TPA: ABC transporter ATP-binding protein [Clostridiaceae bacterium]|nr:ABC transporter ATP-binding protein [Clostridiaceae bacterium]